MIACFLSNMSAKYYKNRSMLSRDIAKNVGDVFFETQCTLSVNCMGPTKVTVPVPYFHNVTQTLHYCLPWLFVTSQASSTNSAIIISQIKHVYYETFLLCEILKMHYSRYVTRAYVISQEQSHRERVVEMSTNFTYQRFRV